MKKSSFLETDPILNWLNRHGSADIHRYSCTIPLHFGCLNVTGNSSYFVEACLKHFFHAPMPGPWKGKREVSLEFYDAGRGNDFPDGLFVSRSEITHYSGKHAHFFCHPAGCLVSLPIHPHQPIRMLTGILKTRGFSIRKKQTSPFQLKTSGSVPEETLMDLVKMLYVRYHQWLCLHGALLKIRNSGVLLTGPSGVGKTTAALALMRGGFNLLSDELTLLKPIPKKGVTAHGLLTPPRLDLKEGDLNHLELTLSGSSSKPKGFVPLPSSVIVSAMHTKVVPRLILFLERTGCPKKNHQMIPCQPQDAFVRLMDQALDFSEFFDQKNRLNTLGRLVDGCRLFRLVLGSDLKSLPQTVLSGIL